MIEVRVLGQAEVEEVGDLLGLARLHQGDGFYLALTDPPELQAQ